MCAGDRRRQVLRAWSGVLWVLRIEGRRGSVEALREAGHLLFRERTSRAALTACALRQFELVVNASSPLRWHGTSSWQQQPAAAKSASATPGSITRHFSSPDMPFLTTSFPAAAHQVGNALSEPQLEQHSLGARIFLALGRKEGRRRPAAKRSISSTVIEGDSASSSRQS